MNFAKAPPVVSARDLIAGGAKPGPEIGSAIREAEVQAYFGKGLDDSENIIEAKKRKAENIEQGMDERHGKSARKA